MKALAQKKRLPTNNKNSFTSATRDQTTRLPSDCSLDEPRRHTRIIRRCIETFGKPIFRPVIPLYARLMKPPRSSSRLRPMTLLPALRLTATPTESSAGNWRGARTRRGRHGARAQWGFRLGARGSSGGAARDYLRFYHADSSQYLVSVFGGGRPRKRPMGAVPRWGSAVEVDGLLSSVTHRAGIGAWIQQNVQLEVPSSRQRHFATHSSAFFTALTTQARGTSCKGIASLEGSLASANSGNSAFDGSCPRTAAARTN